MMILSLVIWICDWTVAISFKQSENNLLPDKIIQQSTSRHEIQKLRRDHLMIFWNLQKNIWLMIDFRIDCCFSLHNFGRVTLHSVGDPRRNEIPSFFLTIIQSFTCRYEYYRTVAALKSPPCVVGLQPVTEVIVVVGYSLIVYHFI